MERIVRCFDKGVNRIKKLAQKVAALAVGPLEMATKAPEIRAIATPESTR